jgi:RNA-splicing ligase RtcB
VRRVSEEGAAAAAEDGLFEEEDLAHLEPVEGDPTRSDGGRSQPGRGTGKEGFGLEVSVVGEVLDGEGAEALGCGGGCWRSWCGSGRGPRQARVGHAPGPDLHPDQGRRRLRGRGRPASAPLEAEEAADLVAATHAASNFADARAARAVYALRRVLGDRRR